MSKIGLLYRPASSKCQDVTPFNGLDFSLEELQNHCGGYVEIHPMPAPSEDIIIMNEDAQRLRLPINTFASIAAYHLETCEGIRGNVIICHKSMVI